MSDVISKCGIHCIGGDRDGYGPFTRRIAEAGRRLALVKCRDDFGAMDEPLALWLEIVTIGAMTDFDRLPFNYAAFEARALLNPKVKVWEVLNEEDSPATYAAKADLYISIAPRFKAHGWGLGLFNCGSGNPPYPSEDGGVSYAQIARACKYMLDNDIPAYLFVHEYKSDGGTIGRYKVLADYLAAHGALLPIAITEWGFETNPGNAEYLAFVKQIDPLYMADPRVLGCAMWTLGGGGWGASNYDTLLPELGEYIAKVPPVEPEIPPANDLEFIGHFDANTGALISAQLNYSFALLANTAIETRYQKKSTGEMFTFHWSVSPAECAPRVTVSHPNGTYSAGTPIRIVAT